MRRPHIDDTVAGLACHLFGPGLPQSGTNRDGNGGLTGERQLDTLTLRPGPMPAANAIPR